MLGKLKPYIGNLYKTLLFNFKFIPIKQAIRLPVIVSRKVVIDKRSKGKVIIPESLGWGKIRIGFHVLNTSDFSFERSLLKIDGTLIFKGSAFIAQGCRIDIKKQGKLVIGEGFNSTGKMEIVCYKNIDFNDDCVISWDTLFMDSDSHPITDNTGKVINNNASISIGKHVWICCRSVILKGASVADNTVIACNSLITRSYTEKNAIIGGAPAELIKENISWNRNSPD